MSDLKNCPFCGTKPMVSLHGHVKCCLFHCVAHKRWMTKEEWNTRPTESALLAALQAVEWVFDESTGGHACPWCEGAAPWANYLPRGHAEDCQRQAAIKLAGG